MRVSKFNHRQIAEALRRVAAGIPVSQVCRDLGIPRTTLYRWRSQRDASAPTAAAELRELRKENQKLREIVANFLLDTVPLRGSALKTPSLER